MTNALTITTIETEARVLDTDLATELGMSRPRDIRANIIDPNCDELGGFGILRSVNANAGKRGRPAIAFYLNEAQALLVCMLSRTFKAEQLRAELERHVAARNA